MTPAPHSKAGQVRALIDVALAAGLRVTAIVSERGAVRIETAPLADAPREGDDAAGEWLRRQGAG